MRKAKSKPTKRNAKDQPPKISAIPERLTFVAHLQELRKRLFYVAVSIGLFGAIAATFQQQLTTWLLKPADGQQFIFTTPGGGFDFLFKLILYAGIAGSIPVIVYQLIRYLQPLVREPTQRFVRRTTCWSSLLALTGIAFGYFIGLPAAMHFLLQGFSSEQIKALITIQSYMSFVMIYLLGSALLFQLPLILMVVNRFRRLKPRTLVRQQRWVILGAAIAGAVISPTPDIRNMLMLSGPIVCTYEFSILLIWLVNRKHRRPKKIVELLRKDAQVQAERLARFKEAQAMWRELLKDTAPVPQPLQGAPAVAANPTSTFSSTTRSAHGYRPAFSRPQQYSRGISRTSYGIRQR